MYRRFAAFGLVALGLAWATACARLQPPVALEPGTAGPAVLSVTAENFSFRPNHIQAPRGTRLVLDVDNVSGTAHNVTVISPGGVVMTSVELPAGRVTRVELPLAQVGDYPFYCAKPFHPALGMRGVIRAR
ncbi:MAG: hypothetical protein Kow0092_19410 [Deferrisomatales bacterium]